MENKEFDEQSKEIMLSIDDIKTLMKMVAVDRLVDDVNKLVDEIQLKAKDGRKINMKKKRLILSILAMLFSLGIMLFSLKVSNIVAEKISYRELKNRKIKQNLKED